MKNPVSFGMKLGLTRTQAATLTCLKTAEKIQNFINKMPVNFELKGDTCLSVAEALRQNRCHCIEAAFVAACAFWLNGEPPLVMDLQSRQDSDHVVAVFKRGNCWGAISKSNHVWLRWRDPIYRNLRELAMSYFHEYVSGPKKTLITYSAAFDMRRIKPELWVSNKDNCWDASNIIDNSRHYRLLTPSQQRSLRPRDKVEVIAGRLLDRKAPTKKSSNEY